MFNTIKSKILIIVSATLLALIVALSLFSLIYFKKTKYICIDAYYRSIAASIHEINKDINKIEDNARDMSIFGEIFYKVSQNSIALDKYVLKIILEYRESISGGIFYEPYAINPKQERFCSFAYLNKNNQMVLDKNYQTEEHSYLKSVWYKDIKNQIKKRNEIVWSPPYFEDNGVGKYMITAGTGIYSSGKLVGISTADWNIDDIIEDLSVLKPTPNSFILFADKKNDFIILSTDKNLDNENLFGKSLNYIPWYKNNDFSQDIDTFKYNGKTYATYVETMDNGMLLIVNVPENELYSRILLRFVGLFAILIPFCIILCLFLYDSLQKNIIKPIDKLIKLANSIGQGETDITIKIDRPIEFEKLAKTFDEMLQNIKKITKKQTKMASELSIARSIQLASMPSIFPAYPDRNDFDIYASITPAKEVGGDFYDFYFIDNEHLMFLIGDVSGKGIPAALFMMTIKALINSTYQNQSNEKLIETVNSKICEGNKEGFFVTLFACIVNINTGETKYINCGHNPPLVKHNNDNYQYLKLPANLALGIFKDVKYTFVATKLNPGDRIFIYTDGITEANNDKEELFGDNRLKDALNIATNLSLQDTINCIYSKIKDFAGQKKQSDDITMLLFEYKGNSYKKVFKDIALQENYKKFYPMLYEAVSEWNIDDNTANKIYMCAEELYANIIFHAYPNEKGEIEVTISKDNNEIELIYKDEGIEYNPLNKQDPDITLPPEERPLGGLGIYMIKQMADNISYERQNQSNIVKLIFKSL